ncbi:hypothetical protein [Nostoc sp. PA-18-2419]|uniref:hypothetical protein n=1 Tax=Nostoc sp. PA-18-2419 TaxID=2575443 RepID=UPI00167764AF|nr:hypothetical protein [Nostoc sp. PA-18-2419]
MSREQEPSIKPLIGWDSWDNQDTNGELPFIDFNPLESINSEENNFPNNEIVKSNISVIVPNIIENHENNDSSKKVNIQTKTKSNSQKTNKSQREPKNKTQSRKKKSVKSSPAKNVIQAAEASNILNNPYEDIFIAKKETLSAEVNSEVPILKHDFGLSGLDNTTDDNDSPNSITPTITTSTWSNVEEQPSLFRKIGNEELQEISELPFTLPSAEPSVPESILPFSQKTRLDENTTELAENSPREFSLLTNLEEKSTFSGKGNLKNKQQLDTEASQTFEISDIPISVVSPQQDFEISQVTANNQSSTTLNNLIQKQEVSPISSSQSQQEELLNIRSNNLEAITAIEPNFISESTTNDFVTENSLTNAPIPSVINFPSINEVPTLLNPLVNSQQSVESNIPSTLANSEPSLTKNPITVKQEIDSSVTSDSLASPPIQLTPNSNKIEEIKSNFQKYNENEQLVTSESQSAVVGNISDIPANVISLQRDNNLENTISESIENQPILALPEIVEAPKVSNIFPEIVEAPKISNVSSEIVPDFSPKVEKIPNIISQAPSLPLVNPLQKKQEDEKTFVTSNQENSKPLSYNQIDLETGFPNSVTSQEVVQTAKVSNIFSEISELPAVNATSPEIISDFSADIEKLTPNLISQPPSLPLANPLQTKQENLKPLSYNQIDLETGFPNSVTSQEVVQTAKVSNIFPEISEPPAVNPTSPEIISEFSPEVEITTPNLTPQAPSLPLANPLQTKHQSEKTFVNSNQENSKPLFDEERDLDTGFPDSAISQEIVQTAQVSDVSPDIGEPPKISDVSSIVETSSIFRKIVENKQIVESDLLGAIANSENSEIITFVDASDNQDISEKSTFPQNQLSTPPQVEQNTTTKNLAAPKGYATGGQVRDSHHQNNQQIAPSDTIPAMLTPGEFVINTRDAQKNLPLLHHINTGGTPDDIILPSLQIPNLKEPEQKTSPENSTKVDSFSDTSLQLKNLDNQSPEESNSLIPASLGLNTGKKLSVLNSPQLSAVESKKTDVGGTSPQYSSPSLIFRKANSTTNTPSQWSDTPSQWSNVEELFNDGNDEFSSFFSGGESKSQNSEFSTVFPSESSHAPKYVSAPIGFADGGEVTTLTSVNTQPITETIESSALKDEGNNKDDTANLEALAREIYSRLRQRLEIERERHGGFSGRLPW